MSDIVFKIIDKVQYELSDAYKDIDVENIVQTTSKKRFLNPNQERVFSAADRVENTNTINPKTFYIFPIFYNHAEHLDTLDLWRNEAKKFIERNKELFKQKNVVVCVCDPYETSRHFIDSVELLAQDFDFEILAITANKRFNPTCSNVSVIYNDTWLARFLPRQEVINFKPKRLYINLNRVARIHRCMLMDQLIDNDLLKYGYNSWGNTYNNFFNYKEFVNPNTKIEQQKFDVLDIKELSSINPNNSVPEKHCANSFLFLNTETKIESDQLFFSEKVYKPLGIGMPFITLGNPGTLQDLRDRGFITFGDWFDESYDYDYDIQKRISIIVKNIEMYSKYSKKNLVSIRQEMSEITDHNLKLYTALRRKHWLTDNLESYVKNRQRII